MAIISISEASRRWTIGRTNLYRAVKRGRLNLSTRPDGTRGVDTSELVRVFGEPSADTSTGTSEDVHDASSESSPATDPDDHEQARHLFVVNLLQDQVNQLSIQLEQSNEREARLLSMLEVEQQARRELETKLLPAPVPPPKPAPPSHRRVWLLLILLVAVLAFAGWRWWDAIHATVAALVERLS